MKITIAPDSFKGSLTALEAAKNIKKGIESVIPDINFDLKPMSDGGEGIHDVLISVMKGYEIPVSIKGPLGESLNTSIGVIDNETVIIECARIIGLTLVPVDKRNPDKTSSYGLGEAIKIALDKGFKKIIVGLGGSATNDGGLGMLQALGAVMKAKHNKVSIYGESIHSIIDIDLSRIDNRIKNSEIIIANDVNNPLCGKNGASLIYGKQKGSTIIQQQIFDQSLNNYALLIEKKYDLTLKDKPGAGAAGGLGFAFMVLGSHFIQGGQLVGDLIGLEESIQSSDLVITGEGASDMQTLNGKVPYYVSQLAQKYDKKVGLLSGSVSNKDRQILTPYFNYISELVSSSVSMDFALNKAGEVLQERSRELIKSIYEKG